MAEARSAAAQPAQPAQPALGSEAAGAAPRREPQPRDSAEPPRAAAAADALRKLCELREPKNVRELREQVATLQEQVEALRVQAATGAVGWPPGERAPPVDPALVESQVVQLNVGGHKYETLLSTLRKRDSMLAALFSGRFKVLRDSEGRVFIDRNGALFAHVLDYLRDGSKWVPPAPSKVDLRALRAEVEYFGLEWFDAESAVFEMELPRTEQFDLFSDVITLRSPDPRYRYAFRVRWLRRLGEAQVGVYLAVASGGPLKRDDLEWPVCPGAFTIVLKRPVERKSGELSSAHEIFLGPPAEDISKQGFGFEGFLPVAALVESPTVAVQILFQPSLVV